MSGHEYDDLAQVAADDALLDAFGALSWDYPPIEAPQPTPNPVPEPRSSLNPVDADPLLGLLQALRADVDEDAPIVVADAGLAPVVPLRSRRALRRGAISAAVAVAVLSVSGVAAAGFSGVGTPLYPLHEALFGPTASQQALQRAERFLVLARADLDAGRLRAADEALDQAAGALRRVDPEEQGSLPAQLSALRDALSAAFAADTARLTARQDAEARAAAEQAGHGKGSATSEGQHGSGTDSRGKDGEHPTAGNRHDNGETDRGSGSGHHPDSAEPDGSGSPDSGSPESGSSDSGSSDSGSPDSGSSGSGSSGSGSPDSGGDSHVSPGD